jgi:hypothetical protein
MTIKWSVDQLMKNKEHPGYIKAVAEEEYLQWARGFVFEGLRDQRYGQSFCNYFNIHDNILFYSSTVADADRYIRKVYVR